MYISHVLKTTDSYELQNKYLRMRYFFRNHLTTITFTPELQVTNIVTVNEL